MRHTQPKQLGNHCHVCNFLRCDSICYFNAQNVILSMFNDDDDDDGGEGGLRYYCTVRYALLSTSSFTHVTYKLKSDARVELSRAAGSVVYKLPWPAREDGNIVSDASFDLTAIWTERSCCSSVVTAHHRVERKSSPLLYMVRKLYRSMDVMNGLYIQSNHYLWPV